MEKAAETQTSFQIASHKRVPTSYGVQIPLRGQEDRHSDNIEDLWVSVFYIGDGDNACSSARHLQTHLPNATTDNIQRWSLPIEFRFSYIPIAIGLSKNYRNIGLTYLSDFTIGLTTLNFR